MTSLCLRKSWRWTIPWQGEFNQGNKSKRILIGFGRRASDVQASVTILLKPKSRGPGERPSKQTRQAPHRKNSAWRYRFRAPFAH